MVKERPPRVYYKNNKPYIILNKKRHFLKIKDNISIKKAIELILKTFRKKKSKRKKRKRTIKKMDISKYPKLEATAWSSGDEKKDKLIARINRDFDYANFLKMTLLNNDERFKDTIEKLENRYGEIIGRLVPPPALPGPEILPALPGPAVPPTIGSEEKEEKEGKEYKGLRQLMRGVYVAPEGVRNVEDVMRNLNEKKRLEREIKQSEIEYLNEMKRSQQLQVDIMNIERKRNVLENKRQALEHNYERLLDEKKREEEKYRYIFNQLVGAQEELRELIEKLRERENQIKDAEDKILELRGRIDIDIKEKREIEEENEKLKYERIKIKEEINKAEEQNKILVGKTKELAVLISDSNNYIATLEEEQKNLQNQIDIESKRFQELKVESTAREEKINDLEKKIEETDRVIISQERTRDILEKDIEILLKNKDITEEENKELKKAHEQLQNINRELEIQKTNLDEEKKRLQQEKEEIEQQKEINYKELVKTQYFLEQELKMKKREEEKKDDKESLLLQIGKKPGQGIYSELKLDDLKELAKMAAVEDKVVYKGKDKKPILSVLPLKYLRAIVENKEYREKEFEKRNSQLFRTYQSRFDEMSAETWKKREKLAERYGEDSKEFKEKMVTITKRLNTFNEKLRKDQREHIEKEKESYELRKKVPSDKNLFLETIRKQIGEIGEEEEKEEKEKSNYDEELQKFLEEKYSKKTSGEEIKENYMEMIKSEFPDATPEEQQMYYDDLKNVIEQTKVEKIKEIKTLKEDIPMPPPPDDPEQGISYKEVDPDEADYNMVINELKKQYEISTDEEEKKKILEEMEGHKKIREYKIKLKKEAIEKEKEKKMNQEKKNVAGEIFKEAAEKMRKKLEEEEKLRNDLTKEGKTKKEIDEIINQKKVIQPLKKEISEESEEKKFVLKPSFTKRRENLVSRSLEDIKIDATMRKINNYFNNAQNAVELREIFKERGFDIQTPDDIKDLISGEIEKKLIDKEKKIQEVRKINSNPEERKRLLGNIMKFDEPLIQEEFIQPIKGKDTLIGKIKKKTEGSTIQEDISALTKNLIKKKETEFSMKKLPEIEQIINAPPGTVILFPASETPTEEEDVVRSRSSLAVTSEKSEKEGKSTDKPEEGSEQTGKGKPIPGGLYSDQIEKIMNRYKNFQGVYASNELNELPTRKRMGFIMNLDPNYKSGSHWVGVYIDTEKDMSVEYYDSFGDPPTKNFMKDIKKIIDKINPDVYLKFKVNKIKRQSANSDNCGIFAIKFLMDRFQGKPFVDCSGYSDVVNGEKEIKKLRTKFQEFGYI
jgi:hypothetical protein